MKKILIGSLIFLFCTSLASASDHFVNCGNANNGNGTTWAAASSGGAVGAFNAIPASLTRGDTYFIASSDSGASSCHEKTYNDTDSGTTRIFIYAATASPTSYAASRVTSITGWNNSTMDACGSAGPVYFTLTSNGSSGTFFNFTTDYYTIDGQCGSGLNDSYGFYPNTIGSTSCVGSGGSSVCYFYKANANHLTIMHMHTEGTHLTSDPVAGPHQAEQVLVASSGSPGHLVLKNNYFLNGYPIIQLRTVPGGTDDMVIDHNIFKNKWQSSNNFHGEACSCSGGSVDTISNIWWTNNLIINSGSTASMFATPGVGHPVPPVNRIGPVYAFGNVNTCTNDADAPIYCTGSAIDDFLDALFVADAVFFNNTNYFQNGFTQATVVEKFGDNTYYSEATNAYLENQLFMEQATGNVAFFSPTSMGTGTYTHDYNSFYDSSIYPSKCSVTNTGTHDHSFNSPCSLAIPTQGLNDITVNGIGLNFHLVSDTDAANSAMWSIPPNLSGDGVHPDPTKDPDGVTRTTSRGAYQFQATRPATTVTNLGSATCISTSSCAVTISSGIAANQGVVVTAVGSATSNVMSSCADSATIQNTYTVDQQSANSNGAYVGVCSAYTFHAVPTNGTVTVTFSSSQGSVLVDVWAINNFASNSWAQCPTLCSNLASTSTTTPSTGTTSGSLSVKSVVLNAFVYTGKWTAWGAGYTGLTKGTQTPAGRKLLVQWKESSSGAQSGNMTQSVGNGNGALISYKEQ